MSAKRNRLHFVQESASALEKEIGIPRQQGKHGARQGLVRLCASGGMRIGRPVGDVGRGGDVRGGGERRYR